MVAHKWSVARLERLALVAVTVLLIVGATALPARGKPTAVAAEAPGARCPTPQQLALQTKIDSGLAYVPAPGSTEPVTLTPVDPGGLKVPFRFSRDDETRIIALSVDHPLPVPAKDLEAAFEGDLERSDGKKVFPLNQRGAQAAIVAEVRSDGRLVKLHVCLDPARPVPAAPGDFQGRITWDAKPMNSAGQPLVSPGEIPVEVTLQYTGAWVVWIAFILAFFAGLAVKLANDEQPGRGKRSRQRNPSGQQAHRSRVPAAKLWEWLAGYTGQPVSRLVVGSVAALVAGFIVFFKGYYGNAAFVGDFTGDLATLFAAIFSAVVAAHAGAGAISKRRS